MITIQAHLENQVAFAPEVLTEMSRALHEVCNALHIFAGDESGRQVVAVRIIDLAGAGLTDARSLRERVLMEARAAA